VTPQAREGLEQCREGELFTADTPGDFAIALAKILDGKFPKMGARARARVTVDYSWQESLAALDRILAPPRRSPPGRMCNTGPVPSRVECNA
jgi:glycosyltransferase involved in cell wall biosynthesis